MGAAEAPPGAGRGERVGDRPPLKAPGPVIYLLFFLSGAAGLVYEVSWSRQVGLVLGNTAEAAALVLAAYFTGLGVGQLVGGRLASRVRPLLGYGVAELLAAAWACLIPALLGIAGISGNPPGAAGPAAWCFLVLLPATVPLGATLPLTAEHLSGGPGGARRVPLAYALNTAGGVVGVAAATAVLLVEVGVRGSNYLAAGASAACGLAACGMAASGQGPGGWGGTRSVGGFDDVVDGRQWWAVAGVSGLGTIALEVLYTRMFALVFHNSTYTFGAVVAVFLVGLALGGGVVAVVGRQRSPRTLAAAAVSLGAVAVAASVVLFVRLTGLEYFSAGETFPGYLGRATGLVAAVVLPPVTLLGTALPAALAAAGGRGKAAGRLAAVNTAAAVGGALAAGFVLAPRLGLWEAFGAVTILFGLTGSALLLAGGRRAGAGLVGLATAGAAAVAASAPTGAVPAPGRGEEVVRHWDSAYGWVDVVRGEVDGALRVRQNLHYRHGSTGPNAVREYRQGRLPLVLHPRPREVAFLGLGTGLTAAPAVVDRDVERAVVVELIPEVVEAARLLGDANLGLIGHPKVEVRVGDARHYLSYTDRQFEVIVADLFVPWEDRAGYLYTVEFYEAARRRLRPGGHFCQWLALYQFGPEEFELVADSFAAVFPEVTLWWGQLDARYGMVALIGGDRVLDLDPARLAARWEAAGEMPGRPDPVLREPADLPNLYLGRWPARPGRRLNTDEHPRLEFAAPVSHRSGRALQGRTLRVYFDRVLTALPPGAGPPARSPDGRLAWQQVALFGP